MKSITYVNNGFAVKFDDGFSEKKNFFRLKRPTGEHVDISPILNKNMVVCPFDNVDFPISSICLVGGAVDEDTHLCVLDNLFYIDDKEYEKYFIRKVHRFPDITIQFFIASQLFNYFPGKTAYKCSAAVVMGYKAVEINDEKFLWDAREAVLNAMSMVDECELDWHPRRNSEHLKFSLLCVAYHIAICQKDRIFLEKIIAQVVEEFNLIGNFFTPSYPISLTLLLGTLVGVKKGGDPQSVNSLLECLEDVFNSAVRDSTVDKLTLFEELGVTHKSVVLSKKLLQNKTDHRSVLQHVLRVKGKRFEALLENFEAIYEK